jgi:GNAT superfamily N-acetyltransferase
VSIKVRQARPEDSAFVLETTSRLSAFGPPPWREAADVVEGEARTLREFFESPDPSSALLIAEAASGEAVGFALLEEARDYFTHDWHGHLGILAVAESAEGQGAGAALIRAAEAWARRRKYPMLTLNVFDGNRHARDVYEHFGFQPDTIRYIKKL